MSRYKRAAVSGFLWQGVGLVGQRLAVFVAYIFFARFLSKGEIGVVGVAVSITVFVEMLRVGGILQALIQFHHNDQIEDAVNTTFWMTLLSGIGWTLALAALGVFLGRFENSPQLGSVMIALSITALIDNLRLCSMAILSRELRFGMRAIADTIASVAGGIIGVIALYRLPHEQQIWSIVIMFVSRSIIATALHLLFAPVRVRGSFHRPIAKQLAKTGWANLSSNLASGSLENLTLVGVKWRTNDNAATGVFDLATRAMSPPTSITHAANNPLFPVLAQSASDPIKARDRVVRSIKAVGMIAGAILVWLIVISPSAIPLVFGAKWSSAVVSAQLIALGILLRTYTYICTNALLAVRHAAAASFTWWTTFAIAVLLMIAWPGTRSDPNQAALIFVLFNFSGAAIGMACAARRFEIRFPAIGKAVLPMVVSCGAAGACAYAALRQSGIRSLVADHLPAGAHAKLAQVLPLAAEAALGSVVFGLLFLPLCGKMMGGSWKSLLSLSGAKELLRLN